jgi:hypothetical protein
MKRICHYSMKRRDEKEENEPSLCHQLVGTC